MKTSYSLRLNVDKVSASDESKMEAIGISYNENVAKISNVTLACYDNYMHVYGDEYIFNYILVDTEDR